MRRQLCQWPHCKSIVCRKLLLFRLNLIIYAAKSHRTNVKAFGDIFYRKRRAAIFFRWFKYGNLNLNGKKRENRPRNTEDLDLQALLGEHDSYSQTKLVDQIDGTQEASSCDCVPWERWRRSANYCLLSYSRGRWSDAKTQNKFCSSDKNGSPFPSDYYGEWKTDIYWKY